MHLLLSLVSSLDFKLLFVPIEANLESVYFKRRLIKYEPWSLIFHQESMLAEINSSCHEENHSKFKRPSNGIQVKKGKGRAQHKQEKERDPDAPKKPANAFFMFCQQQRNSIQGDQKDPTAGPVGHHELTKQLAKEWNTLGAEEKKVGWCTMYIYMVKITQIVSHVLNQASQWDW